MEKKTIVITGASDGIGRAAARALSDRGHEVVIVGRSPQKTQDLASELDAPHYLADFSDLASVSALARDVAANHPRIDVLANNAGGIFGKKRTTTPDGHELTVQVNYLAPFLLTHRLMPVLTASKATVINTSSVANSAFSRFDMEDLESTLRYRPLEAYGNAKLAQILYTKEFDHRYASHGVTSTAFHPGAIASNFSNDSGLASMALFYGSKLRNLFLKTPEQGADTLVYLAEGRPGVDYPTGEYFASRAPAKANKIARDPAAARELWERTIAMLAL